MRLSAISFGNVLWPKMCGHLFVESFESAHAPNFFMLVHSLLEKLTKKEMEHWAITSWAIWNVRNKWYFEDTSVHPVAILRGATSLLDEYQALVANQRTH